MIFQYCQLTETLYRGSTRNRENVMIAPDSVIVLRTFKYDVKVQYIGISAH